MVFRSLTAVGWAYGIPRFGWRHFAHACTRRGFIQPALHPNVKIKQIITGLSLSSDINDLAVRDRQLTPTEISGVPPAWDPGAQVKLCSATAKQRGTKPNGLDERITATAWPGRACRMGCVTAAAGVVDWPTNVGDGTAHPALTHLPHCKRLSSSRLNSTCPPRPETTANYAYFLLRECRTSMLSPDLLASVRSTYTLHVLPSATSGRAIPGFSQCKIDESVLGPFFVLVCLFRLFFLLT